MGGDEEFNFSPDGTRVVFAARVKGKEEPWSTNFDVYETAADGSGEPRNLTADNPAWDTQPSLLGRWPLARLDRDGAARSSRPIASSWC